MEVPAASSSQAPTTKIILFILAVAVLAAAFFWYVKFYRKPAAVPQGLSPAARAPASTLGAQLYEQANNPIKDKLPGTVAPVSNPIQNVYKNPFQ